MRILNEGIDLIKQKEIQRILGQATLYRLMTCPHEDMFRLAEMFDLEDILDASNQLHPLSDEYDFLMKLKTIILLKHDNKKYTEQLMYIDIMDVYTSKISCEGTNIFKRCREKVTDIVSQDIMTCDDYNKGVYDYFKYASRAFVEYDKRYLQLCVIAKIKSNGKTVLTKRLSGDLKGNYSLISGHVDYCNECEYKSFKDYIVRSIVKEITEETTCNIQDYQDKFTIEGTIYDSNDRISECHLGIIVGTDDIKQKIIKTKEPENHRVLLLDDTKLVSIKNKMESWTRGVLFI